MILKTKTIVMALLLSLGMTGAKAFRYVGGDISLLPEYEKAGAIYKDGNTTIKDFLVYCHDEKNMNAMRVRLFVDPDKFSGSQDANACQDLDYILPLCKRIKEAGYALLLDFHYSGTWADPAKQYTPEAWASLSDSELNNKIYSYTKETLETLADNGVWPDMIQTGNEISYGMMWGKYGSSSLKKCYYNSDANWDRFSNLLASAIKACREVCPEAKIVLHTERVANTSNLTSFYDKMKNYGIDYDIIGLSYYPYYHNKMSQLDSSLSALENRNYGKEIMIVETGWSYAWEFSDATYTVEYEASQDGQNAFTQDLINTAGKHSSVTGIFWWWMEYNAYGTSLSGWYNAPLVDSRDGKVQKALTTLAGFGDGTTLPKTTLVYQWLDGNGNNLGTSGSTIKLSDGQNTVQVGIDEYASHQTARAAQFKVYKKTEPAVRAVSAEYAEAVPNTDYQIVDGKGVSVNAYDENVNNMIKFLGAGEYYIEASMPSDAAAAARYTVNDASLYVNVTQDSGTTEPDPVTYPDFYLLYNNGGNWKYPGDKFTNNGNGTYSLSDINISGSDGGNGWFALTTSDSNNWQDADANRYGPVSNTVVTLGTEMDVIFTSSTSWEIAAGTYNLEFDYNNMTLKVTNPEDEVDPGQSWYITGVHNDWALEADDMFEFSNGTYIKTLPELSKFLIVKDAEWDLKYGSVAGQTMELGKAFGLTAGGEDLTFGAGNTVTDAIVVLDIRSMTVTVSGTLVFEEPELHLLGEMNDWKDENGDYIFTNQGGGLYTLYLPSLDKGTEFKIAALDFNPEYSTSDTLMSTGEYDVSTAGSNMGLGEDLTKVLLTLDTKKLTLTIQKDVETNIGAVLPDQSNAVYFNLQGQRVDNPQKGIYIKKEGSTYIKIIL